MKMNIKISKKNPQKKRTKEKINQISYYKVLLKNFNNLHCNYLRKNKKKFRLNKKINKKNLKVYNKTIKNKLMYNKEI